MTTFPAVSLALAAGLTLACAHSTTTSVDRPAAHAALQAAGTDYAALELAADSLAATADWADGSPSERAQATAREFAIRLGRVRGDFESVTLAMTTEQLEQTESLWMRLAASHAALELLREEAGRLSEDPMASPAELHDLAIQLSAALELAWVSSQMAAERVHPDSTTRATPPLSLPAQQRRGQVSTLPRRLSGPNRPTA
jgi:hypothetical protein